MASERKMASDAMVQTRLEDRPSGISSRASETIAGPFSFCACAFSVTS